MKRLSGQPATSISLKGRLLAAGIFAISAGCASLPGASPYAGQEARQIKALSATEIAAYVEGKGQGFAKPAELNGYPGPMHVLELADQLALTEQQKEASKALLVKHKTEARELGVAYVSAEAALEKLFASRLATPEALGVAIENSAKIHSLIRGAYLQTHLQ